MPAGQKSQWQETKALVQGLNLRLLVKIPAYLELFQVRSRLVLSSSKSSRMMKTLKELNTYVLLLVEIVVRDQHQKKPGVGLWCSISALFPKVPVLEKQTRKCLLYLAKYIFDL